mgnify:CR=1 FL=1
MIDWMTYQSVSKSAVKLISPLPVLQLSAPEVPPKLESILKWGLSTILPVTPAVVINPCLADHLVALVFPFRINLLEDVALSRAGITRGALKVAFLARSGSSSPAAPGMLGCAPLTWAMFQYRPVVVEMVTVAISAL